MPNRLKEICANCGFTFGSHCADAHYSNFYKMSIPHNACPGHERRMDWDAGDGTVFSPTGEYKEKRNDKI